MDTTSRGAQGVARADTIGTRVGGQLGPQIGPQLGAELGKELRESALLLGLALVVVGLVTLLASAALLLG